MYGSTMRQFLGLSARQAQIQLRSFRTCRVSRLASDSYDEEPTWELGGRRKVTISDFEDRTYVHIRQYFILDGSEEEQELPSKKGIALTPKQFRRLRKVIDEVLSELENHDISDE